MTLALTTLSLPSSNLTSSLYSLSSSRHRLKLRSSKASSQISVNSPTSDSASLEFRKTGVIVIGAGLAGLAAAIRLNSENVPFVLVEASDDVGGRVRSDVVDGFILDRGFQIFITAYPEARRLLDYEALNLQKFYSGAQVFYNGRFHTVADPLRHFWDSVQTLANPIGTVIDKLLIGLTRIRVLTLSDDQIFSADEVSIMDLLRRIGFSQSIVDRFFRPFFGGIFFDRNLETTSRLFDFIFKCLALGDNTLPANGISAIPKQLASKLPGNSILFNSRVVSVDFESNSTAKVKLQSGEVLTSDIGIILAVDEPAAVQLLDAKPLPQKNPVRSTVCLYFSTDRNKIPVNDPVLFLNGSGKGMVNNMFFATNVAPTYGPPEKALVSVSLIGLFEGVSDDDLTAEVVHELSDWFGSSIVRSWSHLRTYRVGFAQPNQSPPTDLTKDPRFGSGLYLCGDYMTSATFDGALVSGTKAAQALIQDRVLVPK